MIVVVRINFSNQYCSFFRILGLYKKIFILLIFVIILLHLGLIDGDIFTCISLDNTFRCAPGHIGFIVFIVVFNCPLMHIQSYDEQNYIMHYLNIELYITNHYINEWVIEKKYSCTNNKHDPVTMEEYECSKEG